MSITVNVDSYISVADATTYCELMGLTTPAETSLKRATIALDRLYGARFIGIKATLEQPLLWPRRPTMAQVDSSQDWYVVDSFGNYRNFTNTPVEVQEAVVELAVLLEAGTDIYAQAGPTITEESVDVGVKESLKYQFGYRIDPLNKVSVILAPLLQTSSIRMVR